MSIVLYFPKENILPQLKMTKYQKDFHFTVYYFILENFKTLKVLWAEFRKEVLGFIIWYHLISRGSKTGLALSSWDCSEQMQLVWTPWASGGQDFTREVHSDLFFLLNSVSLSELFSFAPDKKWSVASVFPPTGFAHQNEQKGAHFPITS